MFGWKQQDMARLYGSESRRPRAHVSIDLNFWLIQSLWTIASFTEVGHLEGRGLCVITQCTGNAIQAAYGLHSGELLRLAGMRLFMLPGGASSLVPCKPPQAGTECTASNYWLEATPSCHSPTKYPFMIPCAWSLPSGRREGDVHQPWQPFRLDRNFACLSSA